MWCIYNTDYGLWFFVGINLTLDECGKNRRHQRELSPEKIISQCTHAVMYLESGVFVALLLLCSTLGDPRDD